MRERYQEVFHQDAVAGNATMQEKQDVKPYEAWIDKSNVVPRTYTEETVVRPGGGVLIKRVPVYSPEELNQPRFEAPNRALTKNVGEPGSSADSKRGNRFGNKIR